MALFIEEGINASTTVLNEEEVALFVHPISTWLRSVIIFVISFLIILSNIINLTVLRITEQIPTISRFCLINLSCADFLIGCISCAPCVLSSSLDRWIYGDIWCQISGINHSSSMTVAVWSMSLISIDRYIAIVHPLRYHELMTIKRCRLIIASFWIISLMTYMLPLAVKGNFIYYRYSPDEAMCGLYWEFRWFCILTSFYVPFLSGTVLGITNYRIIRVVARMNTDQNERTVHHKSRNSNHKEAFSSNTKYCHNSTVDRSPRKTVTKENRSSGLQTISCDVHRTEVVNEPREKAHDLRVVKILGITATGFFVIFGPYVVGTVIKSWVPSVVLSAQYRFVTIWMANCNSFINVIIYSVMYSSFRKNAWRLIKMVVMCRFFSKTHNAVFPASDA